jgi:uncharacterized protein YggE
MIERCKRLIVSTLVLGAILPGPAVQAAEMPNHPFVTASGRSELWMRPDIGELKFEAGAQNVSAETAANELLTLSASIMQLIADHGVPEDDITAYEVQKKIVPVNGSLDPAYSLSRFFSVRVRGLEQWPDLLEQLMKMDHVDSVSTSFDRSDSDDINMQLMSGAADDARKKATLLAQSFGRKLGPVTAIARGPLDKIGAPFIEQEAGRERRGTRAQTGKYAVPTSIPYSQTVNAIFMLK